MDATLLTQNITHFAQADGTLFTRQPLLDIIGDDGCQTGALQILEGIIPENLDRHTSILLKHIQRVRAPMEINMTFQDMKNGFNKWREQTTTSPSNKHLGVYKSLRSAINHNIYTQHEKDNEIQYNKNNQPTPIAEIALYIQYNLMTLAISHCHTYKRWQVVHNFLN
jgi:hypothetical protein